MEDIYFVIFESEEYLRDESRELLFDFCEILRIKSAKKPVKNICTPSIMSKIPRNKRGLLPIACP